MRFTNAVVGLVVILPAAVAGQTTDSLSQQGRHILSVGLGVTGTRETNIGPNYQTTARATGALATLGYARFVSPSVAIEVAATALDANASVSNAGTRASSVTALLLGIRYAPRWLAITPSVRPYVSAAVGPFLHSASSTAIGSTYAGLESHFGCRFGAGASFHIARRMALLVQSDYHAARTFHMTTGEVAYPSGASLSFGLGYSWGR